MTIKHTCPESLRHSGVMKTINVSEPPKLVRGEFLMWKQRMKDFLILFDAALWRSIADGPYAPPDYSDKDIKGTDVDQKARAILTMALSDEIYKGLLHCKSAKELWDSLCEQYEETHQVLEGRKNLLIHEYDWFSHISGESMTQQFERFMLLVSELKFYGKIYENKCMLKKFMNALPSHWAKHTTLIRGFQDLTKITLTQLHGLLETYELEYKQMCINEGGIQAEQAIAAGGSSFSSLTSENLEQFHPDDLEEMDLQYQMAMLNLKIKRFTDRTGRSFDRDSRRMRFGFDKSQAVCYTCHQTGHFTRECRSRVATHAETTTSNQGRSTGKSFDRSYRY